VYSSGAGIALGLIIRHFLGLSSEAEALVVDPVIPSALDGLRVHTTLAGRAIEVKYRVGAKGHGVNRITLNDAALSFTHAANPHRRGAARVPMASVSSALTAERNVLSIEIG
jgi:CRISPR-associated protein Csx3